MSAEEPVPSGVTPSEVPTIGITSSVVDEAVTAVALPPSADGESGENSDSDIGADSGDDEADGAAPAPTPATAGMSKSAIKRAAKRERQIAKHKEKRAQKRDAKRAAKAAAGGPAPTDKPAAVERGPMPAEVLVQRKTRIALEKAAYLERCSTGQRIVLDCDFFDLMTDTERSSIAQQINQAYGANKRAAKPLLLSLAGVSDPMRAVLGKISGFPNWPITCKTEPILSVFDLSELVYLTADSDTVLLELDPAKVYVVGAFVDRNRHKGLTKARADAAGIPTARLPIGEFMKMNGCKVLTTNHVCHILSAFCETKDWGTAFNTVIPVRKANPEFKAAKAERRKRRRAGGEDGAAAGEEAAAGAPAGDEDAGDDGDGNGPGASGDSDGAEEDTGTAAVVPTAASETVAP